MSSHPQVSSQHSWFQKICMAIQPHVCACVHARTPHGRVRAHIRTCSYTNASQPCTLSNAAVRVQCFLREGCCTVSTLHANGVTAFSPSLEQKWEYCLSLSLKDCKTDFAKIKFNKDLSRDTFRFLISCFWSKPRFETPKMISRYDAKEVTTGFRTLVSQSWGAGEHLHSLLPSHLTYAVTEMFSTCSVYIISFGFHAFFSILLKTCCALQFL